MLVRYVGPHRPGVDVETLDHGPLGTVEHGHQIDLPADVAKSLLLQGPEHWEPVKAKKKEG